MTPSTSRHTDGGQRSRVGAVRTPTAPARSSPSTDIEADILSEACRPGVGEPVAVHIRPAVYARIVADTPSGRSQELLARGATRIPFVVDDRIPEAPGYEIHRAAPQAWT